MFNNNKKEKGVSLYLAVVVMATVLAIVFGMSAILLGQIKVVRGMGYSVIALYAADTGIEHALYDIRKVEGGTGNVSGSLGTDHTYNVTMLPSGGDTYLRSIGTYKEVQRAIEARF